MHRINILDLGDNPGNLEKEVSSTESAGLEQKSGCVHPGWMKSTAAAIAFTLFYAVLPKGVHAAEQKCQTGGKHLQPKKSYVLDCQGEGVKVFPGETPLEAITAHAKTKAREYQEGWLEQASIYANAVYGPDAMNTPVKEEETIRVCVNYGDKPCTPISRGVPGADKKNYDEDNDGYKSKEGSGNDCDDKNSKVNPGAEEICGNSIDDNCNGQVDDGCPVTTSVTPPAGNGKEKKTWYERAKEWCNQDDDHKGACVGLGVLGTAAVGSGIYALIQGMAGGDNGKDHAKHPGNNGDPGDL